MSGARYDDLKDMLCEVQMRTVLQDAWAIIDHHLIYKKESAVPKALQRKLNSLAGLFETADDQFEQIRKEREEYVLEIRDSSSSALDFLANDVNADSIEEYLQWKFNDVPIEELPNQISFVMEHFPYDNFKTLDQIDKIINETENARSKIRENLKSKFDGKVPAAVEFGWAFCVKNDDYFTKQNLSSEWRKIIQQYR
jgi:thymidylate synthase